MEPRAKRVGMALVLSAIIIVLRFLFPTPSDGFLFLLIAPIAIVAVEFAFAGGLIAACLAGVVAAIFKLSGEMEYTSVGLGVRILTFLIAGAGVGFLVEDRKKREAALAKLERQAEEHREGLQLNDDVVQGLAVAKMALEMDEADRALVTLQKTLKRAQEIASQRLRHESSLTRVEGVRRD